MKRVSSDQEKKDLELHKLRLEIEKIKQETTESKIRKFSAWGPTTIAVIALIVADRNGLFEAKLTKLQNEEWELRNKRDTLSRINKNLSSKNSKLELQITSSQDSLYALREEKYELEKDKQTLLTERKTLTAVRDELINNNSALLAENKIKTKNEDSLKRQVKAQDCMFDAGQFFKEVGINDLTQFKMNELEIVNLDLNNLGFVDFLEKITVYEVSQRDHPSGLKVSYMQIKNGGSVPMQSVAIYARQFHNRVGNFFSCYKRLTPQQKLSIIQKVRKNPHSYLDQ
jgi:hypothetical protein